MDARSILLFHAGALGDFVLTWFIPRALSRLFPDREIVYVTHSAKGHLAARFLGTSFSSVDLCGWHTLFADTPAPQVTARKLLDRAEAAISFMATQQDPFTRNLNMLAPGLGICCVQPIPEPDYPRHVTSYYLDQLSASFPAIPFEQAIADLAVSGVPANRSSSSRVLLHPGAGSQRKCWPLESYLALAEQFAQSGREVVILLGEAEMDRLPERIREEIAARYPVIVPSDYVALAEELLNARLLVTNDNGPGHLAATLGASVLSIFGPTCPTTWRPVGPAARVIHNEMLTAITPAQVLDAAHELL